MGYVTGILTSCFSSVLFLVFLIAFIGFALGRIPIKGMMLGNAAVFLVALVFGHFGFGDDSLLSTIGLVAIDGAEMKSSMSLIENIGLLCFVTSVGFIAGPNFFSNLKANAKSYVQLASIIVLSGAAVCALIILLTPIDSAMGVGIMSGALTSTPGFSAAIDAVGSNDLLVEEITVGHAVAYPLGVIGVVLFVQIAPKIMRVDMPEEVKLIHVGSEAVKPQRRAGLLELDRLGLGAFALAIVLGILIGKVSMPLPGGASVSLGNTGGALLVGLVLGHFGHIGPVSMEINGKFLASFREFGLVMFLIGAGVPGGADFVSILDEYGFVLFLYGALMEFVPMVLGFLVARYVVKLCLLNNLGAITGGMTSTPALGALIAVAGTDDVTAAYASTYPVALVLVVLCCQFLVLFL